MNHIIHDVDRDGWGSAALVVSERGPENCRIYPTKDKNALPVLAGISVSVGDTVWVLDIPAPIDWRGLPDFGSVDLIWVDHHLNAWMQPIPRTVKVFLPSDAKPTTTMGLLFHAKLVKADNGHQFIRDLCSRNGSPWGHVFDALEARIFDLPVSIERLTELLADAPKGTPVPLEFVPLLTVSAAREKDVARLLEEAQWEFNGRLIVVYLPKAHGIPLKRFSLQVANSHPGKIVVLVHRLSLLYCGRDSSAKGLDFLHHFKSRNLEPLGHSYVCCVKVSGAQVQRELDALGQAVNGDDK